MLKKFFAFSDHSSLLDKATQSNEKTAAYSLANETWIQIAHHLDAGTLADLALTSKRMRDVSRAATQSIRPRNNGVDIKTTIEDFAQNGLQKVNLQHIQKKERKSVFNKVLEPHVASGKINKIYQSDAHEFPFELNLTKDFRDTPRAKIGVNDSNIQVFFNQAIQTLFSNIKS